MDSGRPQALNLPQLAPHWPAGRKFLSLCKMRRGTSPGCWVVAEDSRESSSWPAVAGVPQGRVWESLEVGVGRDMGSGVGRAHVTGLSKGRVASGSLTVG